MAKKTKESFGQHILWSKTDLTPSRHFHPKAGRLGMLIGLEFFQFIINGGGGGHLYWPRLQVHITGPRHLLSCHTRQPAGKKANYRGGRGMWWGYSTTGVGGGWDGVVGYEYGLRGYAVQCVRYGRCIAKIKEKIRRKN